MKMRFKEDQPAAIKELFAREILDSRGNPTVEVDLRTQAGTVRASVPSGASTGIHEAIELRDKGKRYNGKGVRKAVKNINEVIAKRLRNMPLNQRVLDKQLLKLDGTYEKKNLGANATLAVSMAVCKAEAQSKNIKTYKHIQTLTKKKAALPVPCFNIINGGAHAGNDIAFQEYMLIPFKASSFSQALQIGSEVYHKLKDLLEYDYGPEAINVGDEGGFAPPLEKHTEPLQYIKKAIKACNYTKQCAIGIDAAASQFFSKGKYELDGKLKNTRQMVDIYKNLVKKFNVISIEDPFQEEAFDSFAMLTKAVGKRCQVVGDDLLCTNPGRIHQAITNESCNALLLKINQIGTVTEALDAADLARSEGWNIMVSHRSGETTDHFIADLATGLASGQIKSGAPCRGERVAKYNQLLRIEEDGVKLAKSFR